MVPNEQAEQRLQTSRTELSERIARALPEDGTLEVMKGVHLARLTRSFDKVHSVLEASFCVIAQGSKEVLVGDSRYVYDANNYLLTTLELPRMSQVLAASKEQPYLSFRLELDPLVVSSVMVEAEHYQSAQRGDDACAIAVSPLDANLLDAVVRLVRLIESPAEAPMLLPMITREIIFRLLRGEQGGRLAHLIAAGNYSSAIVKAVQRIRQAFDQPIRVEQLAQDLGMSVSGFHYHFKAVTAMSPLQFQKQIRLQEARRLMQN